MQEQTIKIYITIENNPIKMFVIVLSLAILAILYYIIDTLHKACTHKIYMDCSVSSMNAKTHVCSKK